MAGAGLSAPAAAEGIKATQEGTEPFWGKYQGGILTPAQSHTYFAALDLVSTERADVIKMLQQWTAAAARMTSGQTAAELGQDTAVPGPDSGDALGLPPARL